VGSTEPQLVATKAAINRAATRIQARMFLRNTRGFVSRGGLYARRAPVLALGARAACVSP
jgi:hypothetical protein